MRLRTRSGHDIVKTDRHTVEVTSPSGVTFTDIDERKAAAVGARANKAYKNPDDATDAYADGLVAFALRRMRKELGNN